MQYISPGQARWRERFEKSHCFGLALDTPAVQQQSTGGNIMARTIKLPARANAQSFEDAEVADVRLSLLSPHLPKGEGVIIADGTDTAPKARVRNRNMVKLLKDPQTITTDMIPDEFWQDEDTLPDWIEDYRLAPDDDPEVDGAAEPTDAFLLPPVEVKAHTVADGNEFYPVLSVK